MSAPLHKTYPKRRSITATTEYIKVSTLALKPHALDGVMEMVKLAHKASPVGEYPLKEAYIRGLMAEPPEGHVAVVAMAQNDKRVIGVLAGYIHDNKFYEERAAYDHFFFINPNYRGMKLSYRMVKYFERWCRERDCHRVYMGVMSGYPPALAVLSRYGYTRTKQAVFRRDTHRGKP